jgi:hypothetical protein
MAQHSNYWSCSPFADWIRGTTKLKMGTSEEWHEWETRAKRDYPIRWWIAEEGLGHIQDFVTWPVRKIYDVKYYINNRYVTRTHALTAHPRDIKPGDWCDVGNRFLPCLFNELVEFVEVESAWSHIAWGNAEDRAKYDPPFWATGWWRWRTWRSPQAGLDHLDWAMTLTMDTDWGVEETDPNYGKPTGQAERAKEIKELYTWWTVTYPNRPDPHEASGWSEYCDRLREERGDHWFGMQSKTPETEDMGKRALERCSEIEAAYDAEDEEMMIRLIKIRDSLWT